MDALNDKLEIEKQLIASKKKELEYNNALKERDTRIIIGGRSVQVADPDRMYNLAKERSLARSELQNSQLAARDSEAERNSDRQSQAINQEILARQEMVDELGKMTDEEKKLYAAMLPVTDEMRMLNKVLSDINIPWLNEHSRDYRQDYRDMDDLYKTSGYNLDYDYDAAHQIVADMLKSGIITPSMADEYDRNIETHHNLKQSSDVNTREYPVTTEYGGEVFRQRYGDDDAKSLHKNRFTGTTDYAAKIAELLEAQGGVVNEKNAEDLKLLETLRNRKIFLSGSDYAQTHDYGGITFADAQRDYAGATEYVQDYASEGLTEEELEKLNSKIETWGKRREQKLEAMQNTSEDTEEIARNIADTTATCVPVALTKESADEILTHLQNNTKPETPLYTSDRAANSSGRMVKSGDIALGDFSKYASGTKSAKSGRAVTDEEGYEAKLKKLGAHYRLLDGGEMIFSAAQTDKLWDFSVNPSGFLQNSIEKMNSSILSQVKNVSTVNAPVSTSSNTFTGDIIVSQKVDNASELFKDVSRQGMARLDITKNSRR